VAQEAEHLLCKCKALNSNPTPPKKKNPQKINIGRNLAKLEPLCTVGRNVNGTVPMENDMAISKKLKITLPYN
jgi:hypothetical protein